MIAILMIFVASMAIAQVPAELCKDMSQAPVALESVTELTCALAKEHVTSFFKTSDPCVGKDLLNFDIDLALCGMKPGFGLEVWSSTSGTMSVEKIDQLAREIVRPLRSNKLYRGSLNRPELAKFLKEFSQHLKSNGVNYLSCVDLREAAGQAYSQARAKKRVGECYQVQTFGGVKYVFGAVAREVSVSFEDQKKIETLFGAPDKPYHLDSLGSELVLRNRLTVDDLKELGAIRKASELFEKATLLRHDDAGGFFSNIKGEFSGGDQLNCAMEAASHTVFLRSLQQKGLIQNFEILDPINRAARLSDIKKDISQSGHTAVRLRSKATGQEIVYDSWFEKGGEPAHILLPEDWHRLSLDFKNEFRDVVPLETK